MVALLGVVGLGLVFFLPLKPRTICAQCSVCDAAQILPRGTIEAVCSNCGFAIDTEARVPVPIGVGKPPGWYMCENRYRWWDGARWREWCQGQELNN